MKNDDLIDSLREEHLDLLIRLTFELEASQIIEQLETEIEQTFSDEEELVTQRALAAAYEKLRRQELSARENRSAERRHRRLMRAIEILACVILAIGISAPVAVANIETLRQKIVDFLININEEKDLTDVDPYEDLAVPDGWEGDYYPTFLPAGTLGYEIDPIRKTKITFTMENGEMFVFSESDEDVSTVMGVQNGKFFQFNINDSEARLWEFDEEEHFIRIIWDIDERWFMLETRGLDQKTAYMIAEDVKRISK